METKVRPEEDPFWISDQTETVHLGERLWTMAQLCYQWRRAIIGATFLSAIAAIIISLLLPKWYLGSAKVLLPESSSDGLISSIIDDLGPAAATLLSTGSGDYIRYRAILNSTSVMQNVVDEFDLIEVYDLEIGETTSQDVIDLLRENVAFNVDDEYQFLSVDVLDRDPQRAADMANFFVQQLNQRNATMLAQNASLYRQFLETSVRDTEAKLDSSRAALQAFQEKFGVVDLPSQTEAFISSMAEIRSSIFEVEMQYEALRQQLGPDNSTTRSAQAASQAANREFGEILSGRDALLPVAQDSLPGVSRQYANLYQDVMIQTNILQIIRPLYEQARLDEQREKIAVQVLDPATKPVYKAKPQRTVIVIVSTISGFLMSIALILLLSWYRSNSQRIRDLVAS